MKRIILGLLLLVAQQMPALITDEQLFESRMMSDEDFDRILNPTQEDQQFIYSIAPTAPPSEFMVLLRRIGIPLVQAFFAARRVVRISWRWLLNHVSSNTQRSYECDE